MSKPDTLFFLGWDYAAPSSTVLKRALMDEEFPWTPMAIVHDMLLTDRVDAIPLMRTDDFLARTDLPGTDVVLLVKDGVQRALWLRRIRDLGMRLLDEGELLRRYAAHLAARGMTRNLGPIDVPQAFDDSACDALQVWAGKWPDTTSNRVFNGYKSFLRSGLMSALEAVADADASQHPFFQKKNPQTEAFRACTTGALVWEIADVRSAFIEQAVVANNVGTFEYAFSSVTDDKAAAESIRLAALFDGLGIVPSLSTVVLRAEGITQHTIGSAPVPRREASSKFVRLDVEEPMALLRWLDSNTSQLLAKVRLKRPDDLLQCLQLFPIEQLSLHCDRPGPAGLELTFCKLPPPAAAAAQ